MELSVILVASTIGIFGILLNLAAYAVKSVGGDPDTSAVTIAAHTAVFCLLFAAVYAAQQLYMSEAAVPLALLAFSTWVHLFYRSARHGKRWGKAIGMALGMGVANMVVSMVVFGSVALTIGWEGVVTVGDAMMPLAVGLFYGLIGGAIFVRRIRQSVRYRKIALGIE
jgi:4-amino-4-deoxy-L-arabinose transferase-like glycosyltransferase